MVSVRFGDPRVRQEPEVVAVCAPACVQSPEGLGSHFRGSLVQVP